jgi:hypothetical protein
LVDLIGFIGVAAILFVDQQSIAQSLNNLIKYLNTAAATLIGIGLIISATVLR